MAKSDKAADSVPAGTAEAVKPEPVRQASPVPAALAVNSAVKSKKFPSRLMYMGPSMTEGGVIYRHGQIFNNGLPEKWKERALRDPEFARLLVPLDKVGKAFSEIKTPKSMLANVNRSVESAYLARRKQSREGK